MLRVRIQNVGTRIHLSQFCSSEIIQYINNLERRYSNANQSRFSKESRGNRKTNETSLNS